MGHSIGYVHEQSRPDRDLHVDIIKDNIMPARETDFKRYTTKLVTTFGLPYDYHSIMHYSSTVRLPFEFSLCGLPNKLVILPW